ncbi:hypothetical protein GA830_10500 [Mesorhizobium sp. NBSH29]|uniref:hypothetical protein n=1 Tax=Mesorhizobium sp. NBSH29 TaxID=2654249 RepID=UPI00189669CA|nr:hypothetical protein [Mesorhizobium sp. NBSH29]QPC87124.1 hypothetical protein GA830_10500 [Mesorhizobium sp. NBSH29]
MLQAQPTQLLLLPPDIEEEEKTEFTFAELSDEAKERARDNWRVDEPCHEWWDSTYDDVGTIAPILGIDLDDKVVGKTRDGRDVTEHAIHFSGFWSQGDGACFEGRWQPVNEPSALLDEILYYAPVDGALHDIALVFAELSERHGPNSDHNGRSRFTIKHTGRYCHENSVSIEMDTEGPDGCEEWNELQELTWAAVQRGRGMEGWEDEVSQALRSFMCWIYGQLEAEHDHLTSDDVADESLSDGHLFDEDGDMI